jgi:hypothetical protein
LTEAGRRNGHRTKESGTGLFSLTAEERQAAARKAGNRSAELGVGVHSFTDEQRHETGKKGGAKCAEQGLGFFTLTEDQKQKARSKGGTASHKRNMELKLGFLFQSLEARLAAARKGAAARGFINWSDDELKDLASLSQLPENQHQKGPNKGRPDAESIARQLNGKYHKGDPVRLPKTIRSMMYEQKKAKQG